MEVANTSQPYHTETIFNMNKKLDNNLSQSSGFVNSFINGTNRS